MKTELEMLREIADAVVPRRNPSRFGWLRFVEDADLHFLATAYDCAIEVYEGDETDWALNHDETAIGDAINAELARRAQADKEGGG
jgi:hypothetical protein